MYQVGHRQLFQYFRVVETLRSIAVGVRTQVADENPDRVGLIFSATGTGNLPIASSAGASSVQGIALPDSRPVIMLWHHEAGALTQIAWSTTGKVGGTDVTTIELILDREPCPRSEQLRSFELPPEIRAALGE